MLAETTELADLQVFPWSASPLTDSNRRPPPYHVSGRHARTRAISRGTVSPVNRADQEAGDASQGVTRVVSDVSVLCPRSVVCSYNREHGCGCD
jgi:hypothetical protein